MMIWIAASVVALLGLAAVWTWRAAAPDASMASGSSSTAVVRLSELSRNRAAEVVGLDDQCQGFSRRRLMDLGFTAGTAVIPTLETFARDPRGYQIRGTLIALRRDHASQVLVRPLPDQGGLMPAAQGAG